MYNKRKHFLFQFLFVPDDFLNFAIDFEIRKVFLASALKIKLNIPRFNEQYASYYAIADLNIAGQCACFGHATSCTGPVSCFLRIQSEVFYLV